MTNKYENIGITFITKLQLQVVSVLPFQLLARRGSNASAVCLFVFFMFIFDLFFLFFFLVDF